MYSIFYKMKNHWSYYFNVFFYIADLYTKMEADTSNVAFPFVEVKTEVEEYQEECDNTQNDQIFHVKRVVKLGIS